MTKRKERSLKELYEVTEEILEPEITPVLKGSFRIQGPVDEADHGSQMNTGSSQSGRRFGKRFDPEKVRSRAESGTCNVCAAPCSSCMHFDRAVSYMGLKTDEFSDETCQRKAASRCSFNDAIMLSPFKSRPRDDWQTTASETSNLVSTSSSHDSISENVESKATLKAFDASEERNVLLAEGCFHTKPQSVADQKTFLNQYEEQKGSECNDDNISCVIGASDASMLAGDHNRDVDRSNISNSSVSFNSFLPEGFEKVDHVQTASGARAMLRCEIGQSNNNSSRPITSVKSSATAVLSHTKDLEERSCSHPQGEPSECSTEHVESSLSRVAVSDCVDGGKSAVQKCASTLPKSESSELNVVRSNSSGASMKIYPFLEPETDIYSGDPPNVPMKGSEQVDKLSLLHTVSAMQEPPSMSQLVDESDGSDILLDDVKVCDICGDAGREELLAICSRCNDGAEHTYCMQIMLDKVPEGDWLCEDCKLKEEIDNQKQDKPETVLGTSKASLLTENSQNSGGTGAGHSKLSLKGDIKESDVEGSRSNEVSSSPWVSVKRHADDLEVAPAPKSQAFEIISGSPKATSPNKKSVLSRAGSFKYLDKGKIKQARQMSSFGGIVANNTPGTSHSSTTSGPNSSRIQPRLETLRGTFSKSYSFNTSSSKPRVKPVEDDSFLKLKSPREPATTDAKQEGIAKMLKKSLSFKTPSFGRPNVTESKVKMLPSNISHFEDLKGLKQAKDRNSIERKTSFKSDHPVVSLPTTGSGLSAPKADQKITSRGETVSLISSATNYRDQKAVQLDGKLSTSLKPGSHFSPKAVSGGVKRQSSCLANAVGAPSSDGMCYSSAEQNPNQVIPKNEPTSSSSWSAVRSCNNNDAILQVGLPQPRESTNRVGKTAETSFSKSKQSASAGNKSIHCHRCKEIGHVAQACPMGSPRASVLETSATRSSVEAINKNNKFKNAVARKLPGMYKKKRVPDRSDEIISLTSTDFNCEVASKGQLSTSLSCMKTFISAEGAYEWQDNLRSTTADSSKPTNIDDMKQHVAHSTEAVSSPRGDSDTVISSDGNLSMREMPGITSAVVVPFRNTAIPDHDYIWKGCFQVQRGRRLPDVYDGIQAHLSTCVSPKVLEIVKKLPQEVLLEEVPRLSMWPTQFKNNFATEDNVALYFFAKDIESYEKEYKSLLENIINNDLALKANFDGIELLIFSSNQLPEKSQRWNMLFFLWGVFRGRRAKCSEHISDSQKKLSMPSLNVVPLGENLITPVMPASQKKCLSANMEKDSSACNRFCNTLQASQAMSLELPSSSSSGCADRICDTIVFSHDQNFAGLHKNFNQQADEPDTYSLFGIPASDAQLCVEVNHASISVEEGYGDPESREEEVEPQTFVQETRQNNSPNREEIVLLDLDNSPDRQDTLSFSPKVHSGGRFSESLEVDAVGSIAEKTIQEIMDSNGRIQINVQRLLKEEESLMESETALDRDSLMIDPTEMKDNSWAVNSRKSPNSGYPETVSQASAENWTGIKQAVSWNKRTDSILLDEESEIKKLKRCFSGMYGCDSSRNTNPSPERFSSQRYDMHSRSPISELRHNGVYGKMVVPENSQGSERYFFPVNSGPVKEFCSGSNSTPEPILITDDEDQLETGVPNLELALGAEKKPLKPGVLPLYVGMLDKANNQHKPQNAVANSKDDDDDDDISASLSLSLAFPFSAKERAVKPVTKPEQLLPERHHVNTSLFLYRGFPDT